MVITQGHSHVAREAPVLKTVTVRKDQGPLWAARGRLTQPLNLRKTIEIVPKGKGLVVHHIDFESLADTG